MECLDKGGRTECRGPVELRTTPDRSDGKHFARCEGHFEERLASAERNMELLSDTAPSWFDPAFAGERWEDDY